MPPARREAKRRWSKGGEGVCGLEAQQRNGEVVLWRRVRGGETARTVTRITAREPRRAHGYRASLCQVAALIWGCAHAHIEFSPEMRKRGSVNYTDTMYASLFILKRCTTNEEGEELQGLPQSTFNTKHHFLTKSK